MSRVPLAWLNLSHNRRRLTVSLLGIPHVKAIRSFSMFGFSSIYVIFDDEADFYWCRSRIQ